ncbi:MAG TPA: HD domain-containing protein [Candidatus Ozemobacteraceae bacterium]|nr:HD domain-containing protein [Candidatus Ozemobacteraceae bacterium]
MNDRTEINLFDFLNCLSDVMDWLSPALTSHHLQVSLLAFRIAEQLDWSRDKLNDLVMAGMLHDVGALSLSERMDTLRFEDLTGQRHAVTGAALLSQFEPLANAASIVRFHHVAWNGGAGRQQGGELVPLGSHVIHIADRISLLIDRGREVLGQSREILDRIRGHADTMFHPELVEIVTRLADSEYFWLDLTSPLLGKVLARSSRLGTIMLDNDELLSFANIFRRIIDFRSPFTATHSSGVAASAECLGRLLGLSANESLRLRIAGFVHDLGKLAIPTEIIEKKGCLTPEEYNVMRSHTFCTFRTLEQIDGLQDINRAASFHHERLDGTGYPFHLDGPRLEIGARIMAVADVFTALTEDRPYRPGMKADSVLAILLDHASNGKLDGRLIEIVKAHYDEMNAARATAQAASVREYQAFLETIG